MRHGELTIVQPVTRAANAIDGGEKPFMLLVADDEGSFTVIGSQWVHERWAGAAPIEPSTERHLHHVEGLMLREADRRRHHGLFDDGHPMLLKND